MLNKTDAWSWDHLYTKFERYLDIWSLNYHYHKIIILAQFKYWCRHPLRNYPSITKRQKYASCFWTCNRATRLPSWYYSQPRFSRTKRLFNPVFRPIISFYDGRSLSFSSFFLLSVFYNGDRLDNNCPHGKENRRVVRREEEGPPDRRLAMSGLHLW